MASLVVNNGLQRIGVQASQASISGGSGPTYNAARQIQTMSVDGQASAFLSTDYDLDRNGGLTVTNEFDQVLTTPTRAGGGLGVAGFATVGHSTTIPTGSGNFTIIRIALHDDTATNVTTASDTLVAGVDGQSLAKTVDFTMTPTLNLLYTNV